MHAVQTRTERRPTGDTIGQHWATLEGDEASREYLVKIGMRVKVTPGQQPAFEVFASAKDPGEFLQEVPNPA